jgi:Domain of unknown function (DUF4260)
MQAIAEQISPAPVRRLAWAALFAGSLGAALAVDAGTWQLWVLLVAPDIALFAGIGRGLEKKQLHPRAVPLYNALHHPAGPVVLGLASIALGPAWLVGALGWLAHIAIDRAAGYGPRDARGFIGR